MKKKMYTTPEIEQLDFVVESGFAATDQTQDQTEDFKDGGVIEIG